MPSLKDIKVRVTKDTGEPLQEWGHSRLRGRDVASCYIQSSAEMPFQIGISVESLPLANEPTTIFDQEVEWYCFLLLHEYPQQLRRNALSQLWDLVVGDDVRAYHYAGDPADPSDRPHILLTATYRGSLERSARNIITELEWPDNYPEGVFCRGSHGFRGAIAKSQDGGVRLNDDAHQLDHHGRPMQLRLNKYRNMPCQVGDPRLHADYENRVWHLLASLRFDGQAEAEKTCFIYTYRDHPNFQWKTVMADQKSRSPDGKIIKHGWKFKDAGIAVLDLDKMSLRSEAEEVAKDTDQLLGAMKELGKDKHADQEDSSTLGVIEVRLDRVYIEDKKIAWNWKPTNTAAKDDVHTSQEGVKHITHSVGRIESEVSEESDRQQWQRSWRFVDSKEPAYATFKFYYRGEDVLSKLGFIDPSTPKPVQRAEPTPGQLTQSKSQEREVLALEDPESEPVQRAEPTSGQVTQSKSLKRKASALEDDAHQFRGLAIRVKKSEKADDIDTTIE